MCVCRSFCRGVCAIMYLYVMVCIKIHTVYIFAHAWKAYESEKREEKRIIIYLYLTTTYLTPPYKYDVTFDVHVVITVSHTRIG